MPTPKKFSITGIQNHFEERTYNAEQITFIQSPLESATLRGIPGGGKTASVIGKIIYHFLQGDFTATHHYKLFTFSKRACSDFIEKGKRYHPRIFQKSNIMTLHSLAGKLLSKVSQKRSASKNSVILSAVHLFTADAENPLLREYTLLSECKVIFVDEAQDISDIQYDLIMKISRFYGIPVMMIGDPNQNIYQFQNGSDKYLLEHPGPRYDLIQNYRSTPEIVAFVNEMRPWGNLTPRMVSARAGGEGSASRKPKVIVQTIPKIVDHVISTIRSTEVPLHEIAIIGPVKKCKPIGDSYTNIGLSLFTNLLREAGIPYVKHYEDGDADGSAGDVDRDIHYKEGHVNLFTIHGSKGLEFKTVFLLNFHHQSFGIQPSEESYHAFKYMWYVGVSRAMDNLYLYIDERKNAWYELKSVPLECVEYRTRFPKHLPKLDFREELRPLFFQVTDLLKQKKYMNDTLYHYWYEAIGERTLEKLPLWEEEDAPQIYYEVEDRDTLKLYGIFMENIFNYGYHWRSREMPDFATKAMKMILNTVEVPRKYMRGYTILKARLPDLTKDCITLSMIHSCKHLLSQSEKDLYEYLKMVCEDDYQRPIFLMPQNDVISYPRDRILEKIDILRDFVVEGHEPSTIAFEAIYDLSIFFYQRDHECAYLWKTPVDKHLENLSPQIRYLLRCSESLAIRSPKYQFHPKLWHPHLPIVGEIDMMREGKIVELKYSQSSGMEAHIDQVLMYWMLADPTLSKEMELEIWNIAKGERYILRVDRERIYRVQWLQVFCKAIGQKLKNMTFLYDLTTTGNHYTNQRVDILERQVIDFGCRGAWSSGLVRPRGLLFIPFEITRTTGITKERMEAEGDRWEEMEAEFQNIFRYCEMPIFVSTRGVANTDPLLLQKGLLREGEYKTIDLQQIFSLFQIDLILEEREGVMGTIHRLEERGVTLQDWVKIGSTCEK